MATETLKISDGTTMEICRLPDVDDETWAEVRAYVEGNPATRRAIGIADWANLLAYALVQAIAEHCTAKLAHG
ncbi:Mbd4, partial [Symbiodinium pilosum]